MLICVRWQSWLFIRHNYNKNKLEVRRIKLWPNNGTTTFMGGAVVISVIRRSIQTSSARLRVQTWLWQDGAKCSEIEIFSKVCNTKTNKQRRTAPFLSIHLWPGHVTNGYYNIQWKIAWISAFSMRLQTPLATRGDVWNIRLTVNNVETTKNGSIVR